MPFYPQFRLYEADGLTLVYTFTYVQNILDWADPAKFVEHESLRGIGSIVIPGSEAAYDMPMKFILKGTDYSDLSDKMDDLQSSIVKFEKYILKQDTSISTTKNYYVMRLQSINFPIPDNSNRRVTLQRVELTFRVLSW